MKLKDKVALVTGAAHGQGASHARYLAQEGAKIVALDICHDIPTIYPLGTRSELDETVAQVEEIGSAAIAVEADVRSSEQMEAAVKRAVAEFGGVDILCNNAGACIVQGVEEMSDASLNAVIDTNVKGIFNTARFVVPLMKEQRWGKIINTSSAGALKTLPYSSAYCASKGAVMIATQSWARELAEWEINVNSISPGTIITGMTTGIAGQLDIPMDEAYDQFTAEHVFKGERGHIQVDDISRMVVFLASEDARMITGQNYAVDAGWSIT
jgi:NAD(P)-dependent dehydrogenase (short-subunit alcohol dehydrogenase family)